MSRICLYFNRAPERDRWLPADRFVRPLVRRVIRRKPRPGGIDKVFINLCLGLDRLGVHYEVNLPFGQLRDDDRVGVLGIGPHALDGYDRPNPIVAGIALMTHPSEWPTLCNDYPIVLYLQHSEWTNSIYKPFFGDRCRIWPVGIDTDAWSPSDRDGKSTDFLIYDKILWDRDKQIPRLLDAIRQRLAEQNLTYTELRYGAYHEREYREALGKCRGMIFLCEHESQGLACLECLATDVPVLAWDQGWWLDPIRFASPQPDIRATSVPYFDDRCGLRFRDVENFPHQLARFLDLQRRGSFSPRAYVTENLTVETCATRFLKFLDEAEALALSIPAKKREHGSPVGPPPARGRGPV